MHQRGIEQHDAQLFIARQGAALVIEPPAENLPRGFLHQIALYGLRGLIENSAVAQRAAKFDVFGMRPDERASRAGRLAAKQLESGNIGGVPNLFWKRAAVAGGALFHHREQSFGFVRAAGGKFVVGALSGQQRPGAADSGAIKG